MTTLDKEHRPVAVGLLREVYRRIEIGGAHYICWALEDIVGRSDPRRGCVKALKLLIHERLKNRVGPGVCLESWLLLRGFDTLANPDKVRETRLAWINSMIEEFS